MSSKFNAASGRGIFPESLLDRVMSSGCGTARGASFQWASQWSFALRFGIASATRDSTAHLHGPHVRLRLTGGLCAAIRSAEERGNLREAWHLCYPSRAKAVKADARQSQPHNIDVTCTPIFPEDPDIQDIPFV